MTTATYDRADNLQRVMGWAAVTMSALLGSFLAMFAGGEGVSWGWGAFLGHLSQVVALVLLAIAAIRWPRVGGIIFVLAGLAVAGMFRFQISMAFLFAPLIIAGLLFVFGRPAPRRRAYAVIVICPIVFMSLTALIGLLYQAGIIAE